jgi:C1A family cysteine protease
VHLDDEPRAFLFSYAREYASLLYVRLDGGPTGPDDTLAALKGFLAAGLPVAFGFTVFNSLEADPDVPFPSCYDAPQGGQAVLAVGYDDARRVRSERGALRIRSSWGTDWGEDGCGWLPYRYVTDRLAADFWTLLRPDWLAAGEFAPTL